MSEEKLPCRNCILLPKCISNFDYKNNITCKILRKFVTVELRENNITVFSYEKYSIYENFMKELIPEQFL